MKRFLDKYDSMTRELKTYIKDQKTPHKEIDQISHTMFLVKYGGLYLYEEGLKKGYTIGNEDTHF